MIDFSRIPLPCYYLPGLSAGPGFRASAPAGYTIRNSLLLDGTADYLNLAPNSGDSRRTFTFSTWCKRGKLGAEQFLFACGGASRDRFQISSDDKLQWLENNGTDVNIHSNVLLRDTAGWYHIVFSYDNTQAAAPDRRKIEVNGVALPLTVANEVDQNHDTEVNNPGSTAWRIGSDVNSVASLFNGSMAESVFIDNQKLDATNFGEFDTNGVWRPKGVSGLTFGANGYHLSFANSANLGNDVSGNGNHWTLNGITAANQSTDTPSDNHAVFNYLLKDIRYPWLLSNGNKTAELSGGSEGYGSFPISAAQRSGKRYIEIILDRPHVGNPGVIEGQVVAVAAPDVNWGLIGSSAGTAYTAAYLGSNGSIYERGMSQGTGSVWNTAADIVQVCIDFDAGKGWFGKSNTYQLSGVPSTGANPNFTFPSNQELIIGVGGTAFGTHPILSIAVTPDEWIHTPPAGFGNAWSLNNLPAPAVPDPSSAFQLKEHSGVDGVQSITFDGNSSLQADLAWIKSLGTQSHLVYDSVRGANKSWSPNRADPEDTTAGQFTSFDANGVTFPDDNAGYANFVGRDYIGAYWKKGALYGLNILTWTGDANADQNVPHGLNKTPEIVIAVTLSGLGDNKYVQHVQDYTKKMIFNSVQAQSSASGQFGIPDATNIIAKGSDLNTNGAQYTGIAAHSVPGLSKVGFYTGNGKTDHFIYFDFLPSWIMLKPVVSDNWLIFNGQRSPFNVVDRYLMADTELAETPSAGGSRLLDFVSNGINHKSTHVSTNGNGTVYQYWAMAKHPSGGSGVAPVTAR